MLPMFIEIFIYGYYSIFFYYLIVVFIINFIIITWATMFYHRYRYRITQKTVDIKRGILWKKDVTIPYERIQHVSSTRGPIEQLLGLHIINIFTAGTGSITGGFGGSFGMFAAEGYIPGIIHPEKLKKTIMDKVKESKSGSGLGDKIDKTVDKTGKSQTMDSEVLNELKKIRKILEKN
jgi:hypothetical protein